MEWNNKLKPSGIIENIDDSYAELFGDNHKKISYSLDGGVLNLVSYPNGKTSITDFFVPEHIRNKGIGTQLLKHALSKNKYLSGQFSDDQALKLAYKLGMTGENKTIEEALKAKKNNSYGSYYAEKK
jgi:GNAT superfamily N-acetyltransferase